MAARLSWFSSLWLKIFVVLLKSTAIGVILGHRFANEGDKVKRAREGEDVIRAGYGTGKGATKAGRDFWYYLIC